jgi:hypothetical protein
MIMYVFEVTCQLPEIVIAQAANQVPVLNGGRDLTCSIVYHEVLHH